MAAVDAALFSATPARVPRSASKGPGPRSTSKARSTSKSRDFKTMLSVAPAKCLPRNYKGAPLEDETAFRAAVCTFLGGLEDADRTVTARNALNATVDALSGADHYKHLFPALVSCIVRVQPANVAKVGVKREYCMLLLRIVQDVERCVWLLPSLPRVTGFFIRRMFPGCDVELANMCAAFFATYVTNMGSSTTLRTQPLDIFTELLSDGLDDQNYRTKSTAALCISTVLQSAGWASDQRLTSHKMLKTVIKYLAQPHPETIAPLLSCLGSLVVISGDEFASNTLKTLVPTLLLFLRHREYRARKGMAELIAVLSEHCRSAVGKHAALIREHLQGCRFDNIASVRDAVTEALGAFEKHHPPMFSPSPKKNGGSNSNSTNENSSPNRRAANSGGKTTENALSLKYLTATPKEKSYTPPAGGARSRSRQPGSVAKRLPLSEQSLNPDFNGSFNGSSNCAQVPADGSATTGAACGDLVFTDRKASSKKKSLDSIAPSSPQSRQEQLVDDDNESMSVVSLGSLGEGKGVSGLDCSSHHSSTADLTLDTSDHSNGVASPLSWQVAAGPSANASPLSSAFLESTFTCAEGSGAMPGGGSPIHMPPPSSSAAFSSHKASATTPRGILKRKGATPKKNVSIALSANTVSSTTISIPVGGSPRSTHRACRTPTSGAPSSNASPAAAIVHEIARQVVGSPTPPTPHNLSKLLGITKEGEATPNSAGSSRRGGRSPKTPFYDCNQSEATEDISEMSADFSLSSPSIPSPLRSKPKLPEAAAAAAFSATLPAPSCDDEVMEALIECEAALFEDPSATTAFATTTTTTAENVVCLEVDLAALMAASPGSCLNESSVLSLSMTSPTESAAESAASAVSAARAARSSRRDSIQSMEIERTRIKMDKSPEIKNSPQGRRLKQMQYNNQLLRKAHRRQMAQAEAEAQAQASKVQADAEEAVEAAEAQVQAEEDACFAAAEATATAEAADQADAAAAAAAATLELEHTVEAEHEEEHSSSIQLCMRSDGYVSNDNGVAAVVAPASSEETEPAAAFAGFFASLSRTWVLRVLAVAAGAVAVAVASKKYPFLARNFRSAMLGENGTPAGSSFKAMIRAVLSSRRGSIGLL